MIPTEFVTPDNPERPAPWRYSLRLIEVGNFAARGCKRLLAVNKPTLIKGY
jgi:hypothetical protein